MAKRFVDCPRFAWLPGMLHEFTDERGQKFYNRVDESRVVSLHLHLEGLPVVSDPATRGCLLHLVRNAWYYDHGVYVCPDVELSVRARDWTVIIFREGRPREIGRGSTEAEALAAALEKAP